MDFSLSELLLVAVVAVLAIGPREMPTVVRAVARGLRSLKNLAKEFGRLFDDLAKETGVQETAEELKTEMRLIKGDDGKLYESYDISDLPKNS